MWLPVSSAVAKTNHLAEDGLPYQVVPNFAADVTVPEHIDDPRLAQLPDEPYILQAGDAVPDKGIDVMLEAYRSLPSPPPLVLIGRIAEDLVRSLPDGVTAVGPWPHDLVLYAWRGALLGTVPSLFIDPCPTVAFEAMAAGKAVVGSAIGGLTDQVADGETGILVPSGDPVALASAIARLTADADLRERMGAAARERYLTHFTADVVADRIESIYRDLLGNKGSAAKDTAELSARENAS
jgi:glycosyltransferase involved in cell wall biosynthesis